MLTAKEASSIARQQLFPRIEPYISAISEKIAESAMDGYSCVGYKFSGIDALHEEEVITYLRLIGYDVKISNVANYITILW